jgi:thiamine pyrophosphate-dependent acetolactate synthase large subunit-like protein
MGRRTVADFVAEALVSAGVTHVFGGHGGAVVPLIEAIEANPKLTWVYMRNEANASLAAHAAAKLQPGVVGCCLATSGPGATNLTTGLVSGKMDAVPMIAITGMKPSYKASLVDFQDIENDRLFAGILDYSKRVVHPFQAPLLMRDALGFAVSRRTCVHLAFPEDIQEHELDENHEMLLESAIHPLLSVPPSVVSVQQTAEFVQAQGKAKSRVLIAVGHLGVGAGKEITALAELINAPIVTRLDAKGVVDESHPLCIGVAGVHGSPGVAATRDMIESADCIVSVGVEDQMLGQFLETGGVQNRKLVYVMPDTSTVSGRFNADAVLIGSVADSLHMLTEELAAKGGAKLFTHVAHQPDDDSSAGALDKMIEADGHNFPVTLAWTRLLAGAWRSSTGLSAERVQALGAFRANLAPEPAGCCHPAEIYARSTSAWALPIRSL